MTTTATSAPEPAAVGDLRFTCRTFRSQVSNKGGQELEAICQELFVMAPVAEPEAAAVREALWSDLHQTVGELGLLAEAWEAADGDEAARAFEVSVKVVLGTVERLRAAERWVPIEVVTGLRRASLCSLQPPAVRIVERCRALVEAGLEARELEPQRLSWQDVLGAVADEFADIAAQMDAWGGDPAGRDIATWAAEQLRGGRGTAARELVEWRRLRRECPALPSPPDDEGEDGLAC